MRPLAVVDTTEAEEVGPRLERAHAVRRGRRWCRVDAEAHDHLRLGDRGREALLGDLALPLRVEGKATRRLEDIVEERESDGGLVVAAGCNTARSRTSGKPTTVGWYKYGVKASRSWSLARIASMRSGAIGPCLSIQS